MSGARRGCFHLMLSVKGVTVARKERPERKNCCLESPGRSDTAEGGDLLMGTSQGNFKMVRGRSPRQNKFLQIWWLHVWFWFGNSWAAFINAHQRVFFLFFFSWEINCVMQKQPAVCQQAPSPPGTLSAHERFHIAASLKLRVPNRSDLFRCVEESHLVPRTEEPCLCVPVATRGPECAFHKQSGDSGAAPRLKGQCGGREPLCALHNQEHHLAELICCLLPSALDSRTKETVKSVFHRAALWPSCPAPIFM